MKLPFPKKYRMPALIAVILLLSAPPLIFLWYTTTPRGNGRNVQIINFGKGESLKRVAATLAERGIIRSAGLFVLYARLSGDDSRTKAGYYQVNDGMAPSEILAHMVAGDVYQLRFAVPEGYSIYQVA